MTDYYYGTARIRALEGAIIGKERMNALLETKTVAEMTHLLADYGIEPILDEQQNFLREETLLSVLRGAYAEIASLDGDGKATKLFLYPYDCNNIKAAIKCFLRGIDPASMLFDFGTLSADEIRQAVQKKDFSSFPGAMATASDEAFEAYAKTGNPQKIDLILDKACYADMLSSANASKCDFAKELVRTKIDLTNFLTAVRILRMKSGMAGKLLLTDALIPGGTVAESTVAGWYDLGEEKLSDGIFAAGYGQFAAAVKDCKDNLTAIETASDNCFMAFVQKAKSISVGVEVLIGFLLAHEYEVRNLRILFSGKAAGLDRELIRERIRDSYV